MREDLPDQLDKGNLDDYTKDIDSYGPRKDSDDGWHRYATCKKVKVQTDRGCHT